MEHEWNDTAFTHDEFMAIIALIDSAMTIHDLLQVTPKALGAKFASYHHFSDLGDHELKKFTRYHSYNMPTEITDYYDGYEAENYHRENPGIKAVFSRGQYSWLSDLKNDPQVLEMNYDEQIQYAMDAVGDGLCIPLLATKYRYGYAFVGFEKDKSSFDPIMPFQVQFLMQKLHLRYCQLFEALQSEIKLTKREFEVLELLSAGKTNQDIGAILSISTHTVGSYVSRIFLKLGVSDRVNAAIRARAFIVGL